MARQPFDVDDFLETAESLIENLTNPPAEFARPEKENGIWKWTVDGAYELRDQFRAVRKLLQNGDFVKLRANSRIKRRLRMFWGSFCDVSKQFGAEEGLPPLSGRTPYPVGAGLRIQSMQYDCDQIRALAGCHAVASTVSAQPDAPAVPRDGIATATLDAVKELGGKLESQLNSLRKGTEQLGMDEALKVQRSILRRCKDGRLNMKKMLEIIERYREILSDGKGARKRMMAAYNMSEHPDDRDELCALDAKELAALFLTTEGNVRNSEFWKKHCRPLREVGKRSRKTQSLDARATF